MTGLPGGAPHKPRYTRKGMVLILAVTVLGVAALLTVYRVVVKEGERVAEQVEQQDSPLWDPSRHIE